MPAICFRLTRARGASRWLVVAASTLLLIVVSYVLLENEDVVIGRDDRYEYPPSYQPAYGPMEKPTTTGQKLRILPLGDSITVGYGSTSGNGYRAVLYDYLTRTGNLVTMVGARTTGSLKEISHEGWGGFTISEVGFMNAAWGTRPNIIILLAGTNDAVKYNNMPRAAQTLDDLIGALFQACPDTTILVGKPPPSEDVKVMANVKIYNRKITSRVRRRVLKGQRIILVDLFAGFDITTELMDALHPNDAGYDRIAHAWAGGIDLASNAGWINPPVAGPFRILDYPLFDPKVLNGTNEDGT